LETPKRPSTYLSGYACGFFVISASFRQNSQIAHDGTFFHHPAIGKRGNGGEALKLKIVVMNAILNSDQGPIQYWSTADEFKDSALTTETFPTLAAAIAQEPHILHPTSEALLESFDSGLALLATDPNHDHRPIGYLRLEPLLSADLKDRLGLPDDFPEIMELGTMFVDPSPEYRGRGHIKRMCQVLFRQKEAELKSGQLLVIGTTKDYRVLLALQSLESAQFQPLHHLDLAHVAAFTCICTGNFGQGYQYSANACPERIGPEYQDKLDILARHLAEQESTKIPCVMFADNIEKAKRIDEQLKQFFGGDSSVEKLRLALMRQGYFPDKGVFIPLGSLLASASHSH
jgi:hypothetical protein